MSERLYPTPDAVDLLRIVPLAEAAHLSGLNEAELQRRYPDKLIEIGENGFGMRAMHALRLTPGTHD